MIITRRQQMLSNEIHKYDLPAIVDFMMEDKEEAELWKMLNLQFTYSRVKNHSDVTKYKHLFQPAPETDEDYLKIHKDKKKFLHSFEPFTDNDVAIIEKTMDSIKSVIKIDWKEVSDEDYAIESGNIRLFKSVLFYGNILAKVQGFVDHVKTDDGKTFCYLSLNTRDCNLAKERKVEITDNNKVVEAARHELSHVLGLGHSFEQPFDSKRFTVMSYKKSSLDLPSTLMLYDILTFQAYYGANNETNKENTYYNFEDYKDARKEQCIWDAGGSDTVDFSQESFNILDIRDGEFSKCSLDNNLSFAYTTKIENVTSYKHGQSILFLNQEDNVINTFDGNNALYFSDKNIQVDINHENPFERVKQRVLCKGWGNDILYSNRDQYDGQDLIVLDVSNPMALRFNVKGNNLLITNLTLNRKTKEKFMSSLFIANFMEHTDKYMFLVRTKSEKQTGLCKNKYHNTYYQNAQNLIKNNKPNIKLNKNTVQKISEYDEKVAFVNKTKVVERNSYLPLVIGM